MPKTKAKYTLTPEHREQLAPWAEKWKRIIMSTDPMTDAERDLCRKAVADLYAAAKLPPPKRIVFVPSPLVLAFAGGFAAWWWYLNDAATRTATYAATYDATDAATRAATYAATDDATRAATYAATYDSWFNVSPKAMAEVAKAIFGAYYKGALKCSANRYAMWSGGNQWAQYDCFLTFFSDVVGIDLPEYKNYAAWRTLAEHSGPRIVHKDFCMISDRPSKLLVDSENRPHADDGPFCEWRDGSALYMLHGVRAPRWLVETPAEELDPRAFAKIENAEFRREFVRKIGVERLCQKLGTEMLDKSDDGVYELHLIDLRGETGKWPALKMRNPSIGTYHMEFVDKSCRTVQSALEFRNGGPFVHLKPLT